MGKYNIHDDFKKYKSFPIPFSPMLIGIANIYINSTFNNVKKDQGVREIKKKIKGYKGYEIDINIFETESLGENTPCLIYIHGGGFTMQAGPTHKKLINQYALKVPCKVIFVNYRLSNKYHFPIGVEDCYCACQYVYENAEKLGINRDKIAICGDSAGGALAAAVCLMARDRKSFKICFQMLIYPVTDARMITESMRNYDDTPMWNSKLNKKMWDLYLKDGLKTKIEYASPMEATSFRNLPDAYVEVAEFDCLRDEGVNFAEALMENGVNVELNKTLGTIHGYEIEEKSEIVIRNIQRRIEVLKREFDKNPSGPGNFQVQDPK